MPLSHPQVHAFKQLLADYYQGTYKRLLEKIVDGALLHVDETEVHVKRVGKGYVWVFTNLEEVVYLYRPSREGDFYTTCSRTSGASWSLTFMPPMTRCLARSRSASSTYSETSTRILWAIRGMRTSSPLPPLLAVS